LGDPALPEERGISPRRLVWGLIPNWITEADGGRKPINAKAETITSLPSFRSAYVKRRCLIPIDTFFEWKAIKGQKAKQPCAIGMNDGSPFALGGIWESWVHPETGELVRTNSRARLGRVFGNMSQVVESRAGVWGLSCHLPSYQRARLRPAFPSPCPRRPELHVLS